MKHLLHDAAGASGLMNSSRLFRFSKGSAGPNGRQWFFYRSFDTTIFPT
jgi:hypothetical protein